jgi:hypothetical protein
MLRRSALFIVAIRIIKTAPAELPVQYRRLLQRQIVSNFNCYKQGVPLWDVQQIFVKSIFRTVVVRHQPRRAPVAALTGHYFHYNEILRIVFRQLLLSYRVTVKTYRSYPRRKQPWHVNKALKQTPNLKIPQSEILYFCRFYSPVNLF